MDKTLEAAMAEKSVVTKECCRQLYNQSTYLQFSEGCKKMTWFVQSSFNWNPLWKKKKYKESCSFKEAIFDCLIWIATKFHSFTLSGKFWKILFGWKTYCGRIQLDFNSSVYIRGAFAKRILMPFNLQPPYPNKNERVDVKTEITNWNAVIRGKKWLMWFYI